MSLHLEEIRTGLIGDLLDQGAQIRLRLQTLRAEDSQGILYSRASRESRELRQEQRTVAAQLQKLLKLSATKTATAPAQACNLRLRCGEQAEALRREIEQLGEDGLRDLLFRVKYP